MVDISILFASGENMKKGRGIFSDAPIYDNDSVSRVLFSFSTASSFIYATYPPGPDGPSSNAEGKKINPLHIPGLHGLTARKVCLVQRVTHVAGGLLPHLFTLTSIARGGLNLCNTICHHAVTHMKPPLFTGYGAHCSPDFPLR